MAYSVINTVNTTVSGNTFITLNKPASVTPGDLLVAAINGINWTPSPPAGFTTLFNNAMLGMYYRVVDGTEGASFTWTASSVQNWAGILTAIRGVDYHLTNSQASQTNGSGTSVSFSSVNSPGGGLVVVGVGESGSPVSTISNWPPSNGYTNIANVSNGGDTTVAMAYKSDLPPALQSVNNVTADSGVFNWRSMTAAFYKMYSKVGIG